VRPHRDQRQDPLESTDETAEEPAGGLIRHSTSLRHDGSVSCLLGLMTEAGECWIIR
jgi:hypothetical protein